MLLEFIWHRKKSVKLILVFPVLCMTLYIHGYIMVHSSFVFCVYNMWIPNLPTCGIIFRKCEFYVIIRQFFSYYFRRRYIIWLNLGLKTSFAIHDFNISWFYAVTTLIQIVLDNFLECFYREIFTFIIDIRWSHFATLIIFCNYNSITLLCNNWRWNLLQNYNVDVR